MAGGPNAELLGRLQTAARLLHEGRLAEADAICARLTQSDTPSLDALNLHAAIRRGQGRIDDAIALLGRALAITPDNAQLHFNLGVLHQHRGDRAAARAAYEAAHRLDGRLAAASANLGYLYLEDDHLAEAEAAFRDALHGNPQYVNALEGLGVALRRQAREDDAEIVFRQALALQPRNPALHVHLGVVRHGRGDARAAVDHYRQALAIDGTLRECHAFLSTALYDLGDYAGALAANGEALRREPGSARALMMRALILAQAGDGVAAKAVLGFDRFFVAIPPGSTPAGYASHDEFHDAVARAILAHPSLMSDRPNRTTVGGAHTGELFETPTPALAALREHIVGGIETYRATTKSTQSGHPFADALPPRWQLRAWATVLNSGGHQLPHYHPSGWLSGVYHVNVPAVVATATDDAGFIEFGRPSPDYAITFKPDVLAVKPIAGRMLLFPSYYWHRTLPFDSAEQRISVAFDVIPLR